MAWQPMKTYRGYTGSPQRQQTVEELLSGQAIQSEPLGEIMPDLAGAQTGARSSRQIADLLTQRAMGRNATGIVDGLSQLGEAFLANKAIRKADAADRDYSEMVQALQQKAMQGDEASIAMLLSPEAAIGRRDTKERQRVEDTRYDREYADTREDRAQDVDYRNMVFNTQTGQWEKSFEREGDWRTQDVEYRDDRAAAADQQWGAGYGLQRDQFNEGVRQFDLTYGLNRDKLAAEAAGEGAGVAPALAGLPTGVQSAIVSKELGALDESEAAVGQARKAANLARTFMAESEGYGALGGGPLADIGQAASQKTASLKGITAEMIPMMRTPGEGIMTDADAKRYESAVVSINKGRDANQRVLDDLARFERNEVDRDNFMREWQAQNGYGSVGQAKRVWQQYADAEPIFDAETGKPRERRNIYEWLQSQEGMAPAGGGGAAEQTATNPQTGEKLVLRNGQWVPVR